METYSDADIARWTEEDRLLPGERKKLARVLKAFFEGKQPAKRSRSKRTAKRHCA